MNLPVAEDMIHVLIVEDNPVDAEMVEQALQEEQSWATETMLADDGEKAIELLLEHDGRPMQQRPDLIILDLNLPKRDGAEVLQVIRTMDELRGLPVVVLSSSPMDVMKNKLHKANVEANCYLTKPTDLDEFLALGKQFRCCYEKARGSKS